MGALKNAYKHGQMNLETYKQSLDALNIAMTAFYEKKAQSFVNAFYKALVKRTPPIGHTQKNPYGRRYTKALKQGWEVSIEHKDENFEIVAKNDCYYAPFVEYGHIARDYSTWVKGSYMLTVTSDEYQGKIQEFFDKKDAGDWITFETLLKLDTQALRKFNRVMHTKYIANFDKYNYMGETE